MSLTRPRDRVSDRRRVASPPQGAHTRCHPSDGGQVTAFTVIMVAALIMFAGLVLDGGLALAANVRALNEAQEAARSGAQALDLATFRATGNVVLDPAEAVASARQYLAATGNPDAPSVPVTVAGDQVTVTVTRTQRMQILRVVGVQQITVDATATARAAHGVETPEP
jgi:hypothetical protein